MKKSEFRKVLREEIRNVLNEANTKNASIPSIGGAQMTANDLLNNNTKKQLMGKPVKSLQVNIKNAQIDLDFFKDMLKDKRQWQLDADDIKAVKLSIDTREKYISIVNDIIAGK